MLDPVAAILLTCSMQETLLALHLLTSLAASVVLLLQQLDFEQVVATVLTCYAERKRKPAKTLHASGYDKCYWLSCDQFWAATPAEFGASNKN